MHYITDLKKETLTNTFFRKVLYTDPRLQLVVMSLEPGMDIGMESHNLDQFIRIEAGRGKAVVDGVEYVLQDGSALVIPKGVEHNIINTGSDSLKLYSIYAPANHPPDTVHRTKADADAAEKHEHA